MIRAEDVAAVLVTRGDVDLAPILATIPYGDIVIWNNSQRPVDLKAYGRYEAIKETDKRYIYFQDDDCLFTAHDELLAGYVDGKIIANMPAHRTDYTDTVLIGWGSLFHRGLPFSAFRRYGRHFSVDDDLFHRVAADFVFPMLSKWKRVDLGKEDLPYAVADNRTWRQPAYEEEKALCLERARWVRDRT